MRSRLYLYSLLIIVVLYWHYFKVAQILPYLNFGEKWYLNMISTGVGWTSGRTKWWMGRPNDGRTDGQTKWWTDGRADQMMDGRTGRPNDGRTDRWTDRPNDGRTDGRIDGRTGISSYRNARTHLKSDSIRWNCGGAIMGRIFLLFIPLSVLFRFFLYQWKIDAHGWGTTV